MKKTEILKVVNHIKENNTFTELVEDGFIQHTYKGKYNGFHFELHVFPKATIYNEKGWDLLYQGKEVAKKEGRNGIELSICMDKLNMIINGDEPLIKERKEIYEQMEKLKERNARLQNLLSYHLLWD